MRIVITVTPCASYAIDTDLEYKLRGLLYSVIQESHPLYHNSEVPAFTFSNFLPPTNTLEEDESYQIVVGSYSESVLESISDALLGERVTVGELELHIDDISQINPAIGSSGTVTTETGVYCAIPNDKQYDTYWKPDNHSVSTFIDIIESELDRRVDVLTEYDSSDRDFSVFNGVEFNRMKARPYQVASDTTHTFITSKWDLSYEIQNDLHYTYLQLAFSLGVGTKNSLGLGFIWK